MQKTNAAEKPHRPGYREGVAGRGITRREFLRLAGITAAGAALAACNALSPNPSPSGPIRLVYRDWRTDWFPPMAQRLLDEFHAARPNIQVFYNLDPENSQFEEQCLADFEAGTAPDVFQGCCSSFPVWAQKGYALDLRPYVQADLDSATIADWDPVQYRAYFTKDGKQFGLPKYHGAGALYYNKYLFDQYHVDYPDETWNNRDYLQAMKELTLDVDRDGATDVWGGMVDINWERLQVHVNQWGGHFVDPTDPTRSEMAEAPSLQALEWLRARMWDDKIMATALDVQNKGTSAAFVAGQVATIEDGSWSLKSILSGADFRLGVAPLPAGPVRRAALATTDGFGIYAGTKHPDAAWELLKFLISKEYGRAMAQAHLLQPARASLVDEWIGYIRSEYPDQTKGMDLAAFADGQRMGYSVIAETFADQAQADQLTGPAWQQIFTLGQAPVELLKHVSEQIEQAQPKN
ncbi:MAG: sugar ABC transporter substrate-binding protein [Chloroflexi bacterium]|nr:sugar ABC transporter substrate-binding protein [Chloroflexota bacterium]